MAHGVVAGLLSAASGGVTPSDPADTIRCLERVVDSSGLPAYGQALLSRSDADGGRYRRDSIAFSVSHAPSTGNRSYGFNTADRDTHGFG